MKLENSPIISSREVMPGVYLTWLESRDIAAAAKPGQFVMVGCGEETYLRRPLSIHQIDKSRVALLFRVVGKGTDWLSQRRVGEKLDIFGPMGHGFYIRPESKNVLLVAGGMGIAPLRFLSDEASRQKLKVTLLMGAGTAVDLLPVIGIPRHRQVGDALPFDINVISATEDGSEGFRGCITDLVAGYLTHADQVFACGPVGMYRTMAAMPELKGKSVQVSLEIMMGCGVGVCYGCTIRTAKDLKQVCRDGPVFVLDDIRPSILE